MQRHEEMIKERSIDLHSTGHLTLITWYRNWKDKERKRQKRENRLRKVMSIHNVVVMSRKICRTIHQKIYDKVSDPQCFEVP